MHQARFLLLLATVCLLAACASTPGSPGGGTPPSSKTPGSPLPTPPQGGGSGSESESEGEQQGSEGSSQDSESGQDSEAGQEGEAGQQGEESTALPPEWEEEGSESGSTGAGEPTFEEFEGDGFEEPTFEESEGLSQEELEELEKELEEALGDFDEEMQREQTYAQERANDNAAEGNLGGIGNFENYEEGVNDTGNATQGGQSSSSQSASAKANQRQEAESEGGGGESPVDSDQREGDATGQEGVAQEEGVDGPEDIPSGHDDDIVARQIREAAENESDPELRKKLWEEYKKYKNQ